MSWQFRTLVTFVSLPPFPVLEWAWTKFSYVLFRAGLFLSNYAAMDLIAAAAASADSAPLILCHSFKGCTADFMAGRKLEKAQVLFH